MKEIKIVPSKYIPFRQINDAVLIEDKFIIIYDTNNLYFIDLRDNWATYKLNIPKPNIKFENIQKK